MGRAAGGRGGGLRGLRFFAGKSSRVPLDPYTHDTLRRVAVARGLGSVDELMVTLGKQGDEISNSEALELLAKEAGVDAVEDLVLSRYYSNPKGSACRGLLEDYLQLSKSDRDVDRDLAEIARKHLIKFCQYSEDSEK